MSDERQEKLVRMINQIALNNPCNGDTEASAAAVLGHVRKFWARPMKRDIIACVEQGGAELEPAALQAVRALQTEWQPQQAD